MADRPRRLSALPPPRVRAAICGASRRSARAGAGRRDPARDPRQERAGIDIVTDGEMRRESYSNRFATALDGVDVDNPGEALDRTGHPDPVPRVVGPIRRKHAGEVRDVRVSAREYRPPDQDHRARTVHDGAAGAERLLRRRRSGGDGLRRRRERRDQRSERRRRRCGANRRAVHAGASRKRAATAPAINRALEGIDGTTALHLCFGYAALVQ